MNNNNTTDFEKLFHDDLYMYLRSTDMVDERLPEAPDLEQLWPQLGQSYVADGIREYNTGYPSVALGWIMFLGMAVAKYWDVEWDTYSKVPDLYLYLRDRIDFDHMDDYILDKVLCLTLRHVPRLTMLWPNRLRAHIARFATCTWKKAQPMPIVPLLPPFISCILWVLLWS